MIDDATLDRVIEFHGHLCPGLAMGIRAAEVALEQIGPHSVDEEVVAIVETDMCGVDGIQFLTGCTLGKGNLVHRDFGKNAYTFVRRSDGRAIRVSGRPGAFGPEADPERQLLGAKIGARTATADERERWLSGHRERSRQVLAAPIDELFDVQDVAVEPPRMARVFTSVECSSCREGTMETRIRRLDGADLCPPCFDAAVAGVASLSVPTRTRPAGGA
ncbi:MAG: formylmethanofuran dehydrogenase [Acidimicrobiia bacterium]|nr:formylmethanofuran dehydrogenase [Acidimicrobiia bacterium]